MSHGVAWRIRTSAERPTGMEDTGNHNVAILRPATALDEQLRPAAARSWISAD